MENAIRNLYSQTELDKLKKRLTGLRIACIMIACAFLLVCVFLCVKADIVNFKLMLSYAICFSIIGGWIVITIRIAAISNCKNAIKHVSAMLNGEAEKTTGRFEITREHYRIKGGVGMNCVKIYGEPSQIKIWDKKAALFDSSSAKKVLTVYGFITAYEVDDADN